MDAANGEHPREKRACEYLTDFPNGNRCSRCGEIVRVGVGVEACICWRCTNLLAALATKGYFRRKAVPVRACPDCGGSVPKRRRYCKGCAARRLRETQRRKRQRQRGPGHS